MKLYCRLLFYIFLIFFWQYLLKYSYRFFSRFMERVTYIPHHLILNESHYKSLYDYSNLYQIKNLCCIPLLCSNLFWTADGLICAPRPLPSVAGAKTKNFPYLSSFPRRGCGGSRQKMERKFLVLLRRSDIEIIQ